MRSLSLSPSPLLFFILLYQSLSLFLSLSSSHSQVPQSTSPSTDHKRKRHKARGKRKERERKAKAQRRCGPEFVFLFFPPFSLHCLATLYLYSSLPSSTLTARLMTGSSASCEYGRSGRTCLPCSGLVVRVELMAAFLWVCSSASPRKEIKTIQSYSYFSVRSCLVCLGITQSSGLLEQVRRGGYESLSKCIVKRDGSGGRIPFRRCRGPRFPPDLVTLELLIFHWDLVEKPRFIDFG